MISGTCPKVLHIGAVLATCCLVLWAVVGTRPTLQAPRIVPAQPPPSASPQPTITYLPESTVVSPPQSTTARVVNGRTLRPIAAHDLRFGRNVSRRGRALPQGAHARPLSTVVAAVITDGQFRARIDAAIDTWLATVFHTFLMFDALNNESVAAAPLYDGPSMRPPRRVSVSFVTAPRGGAARKAPNAAWKGWATIAFLARAASPAAMRLRYPQQPSSSSPLPSERDVPLWYAIFDDDAVFVPYNLAFSLEPHTREMLAELAPDNASAASSTIRMGPGASDTAAPLRYGGHLVTYCAACRHAKKRFRFAFGGSGIFMSWSFVAALGPHQEACQPLFALIAGDEQLGGCVAVTSALRSRVRPVDLFDGAAYDRPGHALGSAYLSQAPLEPFPVSFHHVKLAEERELLWAAVNLTETTNMTASSPPSPPPVDGDGPLVLWPPLAKILLGERGSADDRPADAAVAARMRAFFNRPPVLFPFHT